MAFESASRLGVRHPAHDALIAGQILFEPSFHPAVSVMFEYTDGGVLEVRAVADPSTRLVLLDRLVVPADVSERVVGALDAVGPSRMDTGGVCLDGMSGVAWLRRGSDTQRWGGHFATVGPSDPLTVIASILLATALERVQARDAVRALERISRYLTGFQPIRASDGPPWLLRIVQRLTSQDLRDLEPILARIGPIDEVTIDLRDCESIAGLAWPVLASFDRSHARVQWLATEPVASTLALHVDPARIS